MAGPDIDMIRVCPFAPDDPGTGWEADFGNCNDAGGRRCHVLPDVAGTMSMTRRRRA